MASLEHGSVPIPGPEIIPEERARLYLVAAPDFGVKAVERARARNQVTIGVAVHRVREGNVALSLFGSPGAVEELRSYVVEQLGPDEQLPVDV